MKFDVYLEGKELKVHLVVILGFLRFLVLAFVKHSKKLPVQMQIDGRVRDELKLGLDSRIIHGNMSLLLDKDGFLISENGKPDYGFKWSAIRKPFWVRHWKSSKDQLLYEVSGSRRLDNDRTGVFGRFKSEYPTKVFEIPSDFGVGQDRLCKLLNWQRLRCNIEQLSDNKS